VFPGQPHNADFAKVKAFADFNMHVVGASFRLLAELPAAIVFQSLAK
jgi:hypothetical protein